jgi:septal ring factor EnvC (AmiA/AmiB activator)
MKYLNNYKLFVEENNPNTPQGYLDSLSKKPKLKPNIQQQKPTDEVDSILQSTEEQRQKVIAQKDAIEKGLLNNIQNMEPENQKDIKIQVKEYGDQVEEFDKTVNQINNLEKQLTKSNKQIKPISYTKNAREKNF